MNTELTDSTFSPTTVAGIILVALDEDTPTAWRFGDHTVRRPDILDPCTGTAVWIGDLIAVEMPMETAAQIARIAYLSGQYARAHRPPIEFGIVVTPHNPDCGPEQTVPHITNPWLAVWREITDILENNR